MAEAKVIPFHFDEAENRTVGLGLFMLNWTVQHHGRSKHNPEEFFRPISRILNLCPSLFDWRLDRTQAKESCRIQNKRCKTHRSTNEFPASRIESTTSAAQLFRESPLGRNFSICRDFQLNRFFPLVRPDSDYRPFPEVARLHEN
jgi:hypothetical protein